MNLDLNDPEVRQQILTVLVTLGTGVIVWIATSLYNKFIKYRPKLTVTFQRPLFSQFNRQYAFFEFGWRSTVTIKNNSKFTSYDITGHFANGHNISDKRDLNTFFQPNNHLDSHETMEFEVEKKLIKKTEDILHITIEDNVRVFHPGTKVPNPEINLKPKEVEDIKFYLRYSNEFGRTFYSRFRKSNGHEKTTFSIIRPYLVHDLKLWIKKKVKGK